MANFQSNSGSDSANTIPALGLRWAALRGMLGSPLINAEDQKPLRDELLQELQSIGQAMSDIPARNGIELCAKIDVVSEELKKMTGDEEDPAQNLLTSIRKDVMALTPRAAQERSSVQLVRGHTPHRSVEATQSVDGARASEAAKGP